MTRPTVTTQWNRDRYNFYIIDVDGDYITDIHGDRLVGLTDTNPIQTSWS